MIVIEEDRRLADEHILFELDTIGSGNGIVAIEIASRANNDFRLNPGRIEYFAFGVGHQNYIEPVVWIQVDVISDADPWRSVARDDAGRVNVDMSPEPRERVSGPQPERMQLARHASEIGERIFRWKSAHTKSDSPVSGWCDRPRMSDPSQLGRKLPTACSR